MDVLKLRFCSHHITELISLQLAMSSLLLYLLVSMVWSIHFGRRNSLNAYLIAQFVLLSNSKPPWTTQRSGILKTDTHTEDGNLSNWNGWRHPEKFKSPRPSETVTMVRSCQNTATTTATTTKSQSVSQWGSNRSTWWWKKWPASSSISRLCTPTTTSDRHPPSVRLLISIHVAYPKILIGKEEGKAGSVFRPLNTSHSSDAACCQCHCLCWGLRRV